LDPIVDHTESTVENSSIPVSEEGVFQPLLSKEMAEISASFEPQDELSSLFDPVAVILAGRQKAGMAADAVDNQQQETVLENAGEFLKYLCFRVANEVYGISLLEIREIIKPRDITEVPGMPDFVAGVLSLRGIIIPVFNLRLRLGLAANEISGSERIIVARWQEGLFGLLVDEVYQVINLFVAAIEEAPTVLDGIDREFVTGIGRHGQRMLILLDLEKIIDLSLC
jgi:purine-binding chemotaxis protein CheW